MYGLCLKLLAVGKQGEQGFFAAGEVGVGDDDALPGDEESGAGFVESFNRRPQAWLGGQALRAMVRLKVNASVGGTLRSGPPVNVSETGCQSGVKMIGL